MNKQRKKEINSYAISLQMIYEKLNIILDNEQDYYDNIPENMQGGLRASNSEDAIDTLTECLENLDEVIDNLRSI